MQVWMLTFIYLIESHPSYPCWQLWEQLDDQTPAAMRVGVARVLSTLSPKHFREFDLSPSKARLLCKWVKESEPPLRSYATIVLASLLSWINVSNSLSIDLSQALIKRLRSGVYEASNFALSLSKERNLNSACEETASLGGATNKESLANQDEISECRVLLNEFVAALTCLGLSIEYTEVLQTAIDEDLVSVIIRLMNKLKNFEMTLNASTDTRIINFASGNPIKSWIPSPLVSQLPLDNLGLSLPSETSVSERLSSPEWMITEAIKALSAVLFAGARMMSQKQLVLQFIGQDGMDLLLEIGDPLIRLQQHFTSGQEKQHISLADSYNIIRDRRGACSAAYGDSHSVLRFLRPKLLRESAAAESLGLSFHNLGVNTASMEKIVKFPRSTLSSLLLLEGSLMKSTSTSIQHYAFHFLLACFCYFKLVHMFDSMGLFSVLSFSALPTALPESIRRYDRSRDAKYIGELEKSLPAEGDGDYEYLVWRSRTGCSMHALVALRQHLRAHLMVVGEWVASVATDLYEEKKHASEKTPRKQDGQHSKTPKKKNTISAVVSKAASSVTLPWKRRKATKYDVLPYLVVLLRHQSLLWRHSATCFIHSNASNSTHPAEVNSLTERHQLPMSATVPDMQTSDGYHPTLLVPPALLIHHKRVPVLLTLVDNAIKHVYNRSNYPEDQSRQTLAVIDMCAYSLDILQILCLLPAGVTELCSSSTSSGLRGPAAILQLASSAMQSDPEISFAAFRVLLTATGIALEINGRHSVPYGCCSKDSEHEDTHGKLSVHPSSSARLLRPTWKHRLQVHRAHRAARRLLRRAQGIRVCYQMLRTKLSPTVADEGRMLITRLLLGISLEPQVPSLLARLQVPNVLASILRNGPQTTALGKFVSSSYESLTHSVEPNELLSLAAEGSSILWGGQDVHLTLRHNRCTYNPLEYLHPGDTSQGSSYSSTFVSQANDTDKVVQRKDAVVVPANVAHWCDFRISAMALIAFISESVSVTGGQQGNSAEPPNFSTHLAESYSEKYSWGRRQEITPASSLVHLLQSPTLRNWMDLDTTEVCTNYLEKESIVRSGNIHYDPNEMLGLIREYLKSAGMEKTAQSLDRERELISTSSRTPKQSRSRRSAKQEKKKRKTIEEVKTSDDRTYDTQHSPGEASSSLLTPKSRKQKRSRDRGNYLPVSKIAKTSLHQLACSFLRNKVRNSEETTATLPTFSLKETLKQPPKNSNVVKSAKKTGAPKNIIDRVRCREGSKTVTWSQYGSPGTFELCQKTYFSRYRPLRTLRDQSLISSCAFSPFIPHLSMVRFDPESFFHRRLLTTGSTNGDIDFHFVGDTSNRFVEDSRTVCITAHRSEITSLKYFYPCVSDPSTFLPRFSSLDDTGVMKIWKADSLFEMAKKSTDEVPADSNIEDTYVEESQVQDSLVSTLSEIGWMDWCQKEPKLLLCPSTIPEIRMFDPDVNDIVRSFPINTPCLEGANYSQWACSSPDDRLMMCDSTLVPECGSAILWDLRMKTAVHHFDRLSPQTGGMGAFHPRGNDVVVQNAVWDLRALRVNKMVRGLDGGANFFFNRNGDVIYAFNDIKSYSNRLPIGFDKSIRVISGNDYSELGPIKCEKPIHDVSLDPANELLCYVADDDNTYAHLLHVGRSKPLDDDSEDDGELEDSDSSDGDEDLGDDAAPFLNDTAWRRLGDDGLSLDDDQYTDVDDTDSYEDNSVIFNDDISLVESDGFRAEEDFPWVSVTGTMEAHPHLFEWIAPTGMAPQEMGDSEQSDEDDED